MNESDYYNWCDECGYIRVTDWNYQTIHGFNYWWILNPKTDKFALIRHTGSWDGNGDLYEVLVEDFETFAGWAERFHRENGSYYK